MKPLNFLQIAVLLLCLFVFNFSAAAQKPNNFKSQEISDADGLPVLIKHLPNWQQIQSEAKLINNSSDLEKALGPRPVFDLIDFTGGTEAVTASYPAGKLLIIEYTTPQASVDADAQFVRRLAENGNGQSTVYRRIGNYNVFVFDIGDEAAASALIDQIKYEKTVQWLGEDPFLFKRMERAFVNTTSDIFVSTVLVIVLGIGLSIVGGLIVGIVYFQLREKRRLVMNEFSDAGGMIRLNLDGLTPDILPERLLKE